MIETKLFVCCHKETMVPEHPLLVPIQVGAALSDQRFPGFLQDDCGENISEKNRSYCELTAQYWAWKNVDAEYYGFFHYRRFLYPDPSAKRIYRIERHPTVQLLEKLGYNDFDKLIRQYDIIVPKKEKMYITVREHYASAPYHHGKDLELAESILGKYRPDYSDAIGEYFGGMAQYFGNIFIMHREVFHNYCEWLFPLLEEFDRRADTTGYCPQEQRVDGYLAERLLGVYVTKRQSVLKTLELPRVVFCNGAEYAKKYALNTLLPPGSRRRSIIKGMWNGENG